MSKFAQIIIDVSSPNLDKYFTYEIPEELTDSVTIGTPVMIPFGKGNKLKKGYVVGLTGKKPDGNFEIKKIDSIAPKGLAIDDSLIALAYQIKRNYGGMLKDALRTVIPVKKSVSANHSKLRVDAFPEITKMVEENPDGVNVSVTLNEEQEAAYSRVVDDFNQGITNTYLLHGVTGSGKTEVYIEIIKKVIAAKKQVIVLIPEISLTYQTVRRFALVFGKRVAFSHSKLSAGERYRMSESARNGEIDIMIGPRSALFTPFNNLGLIIIDEEHEPSYKSDSPPKYHAREVAIMRAKSEGASVLLGSATPSLASYKAAENGEFVLLPLTKRANNASMPKATIVDLRKELQEGNRTPFSRILVEKIGERLEKKEQIMLFINRRGYAGFISCRACGNVPKCPHCDISLTLHKDDKLYCHYCGYSIIKPKKCPKCGSKLIGSFGIGTQKVETMINQIFPSARVLRMDADTTTGKGDYENILSSFRKEEADILVGTQMIVKGHDFPKVTLVGILAADLSLYANDYLSSERTFELLAQASGRAGRGELGGEVIIQTYSPEHYCIEAAATEDYEGFYNQEILFRRVMNYPPFGNMVVVFVSSPSEETNKDVCDKLIYAINQICEKYRFSVEVIGPASASIKKVKDVYRDVIYLKDNDYEKLIKIKDSLEYFVYNQKLRDAHVFFDFNPVNGY